jgi:hypothetical protein
MSETPRTSSKSTLEPAATSNLVEASVLLPSYPGFKPNAEVIPVTMLNTDTDEGRPCRESERSISTFHDLIAGGVAGSASVIVGHPFDTIKVRIQTSSGSGSLASTATSFGGLSSLFRGMGAPLVSASAVNALIFSSYGSSS